MKMITVTFGTITHSQHSFTVVDLDKNEIITVFLDSKMLLDLAEEVYKYYEKGDLIICDETAENGIKFLKQRNLPINNIELLRQLSKKSLLESQNDRFNPNFLKEAGVKDVV